MSNFGGGPCYGNAIRKVFTYTTFYDEITRLFSAHNIAGQ